MCPWVSADCDDEHRGDGVSYSVAASTEAGDSPVIGVGSAGWRKAHNKSTYCFRSSGSCCWRSRWRSAAGFQTVPPPWVRCNRRSQSRRLSGTGMEASQRWNARQWSAGRPGTWSGQRHEQSTPPGQSTADPPALGSAECTATTNIAPTPRHRHGQWMYLLLADTVAAAPWAGMAESDHGVWVAGGGGCLRRRRQRVFT